MATTKIWDMRAHVSKLLAYVANKNKTTMEFENKNFDKAERLAAEILGLPDNHFATEEKKFVSGIVVPVTGKTCIFAFAQDFFDLGINGVVPGAGRMQENHRPTNICMLVEYVDRPFCLFFGDADLNCARISALHDVQADKEDIFVDKTVIGILSGKFFPHH